jgi:pSer/pThr/pTyr-binding forkhead associated (FHA) protein
MEAMETMVSTSVTVRKKRIIRPHFLEQIEGAGAPRRVALEDDQLWMGRADDVDIRIRHAKSSRKHAWLQRKAGEYMMTDNDSRNGFFLNGLKVHSAVLREGDIIQVTDCVFVYHER